LSYEEFDEDSGDENYMEQEEPQTLEEMLWAPELLHNLVDLAPPIRRRRRNHDAQQPQHPLPVGEHGELNDYPHEEEDEIPSLGEPDNPNGVDLGVPDCLDPWEVNGREPTR
jgi:hypothetical protein